jgi:WD40 repeat protein
MRTKSLRIAIYFLFILCVIINASYAGEDVLENRRISNPVLNSTKKVFESPISVFIQSGPQHYFDNVELSSDGSYMLASGGNVVKIWDMKSGRELRTFTGIKASFDSNGDNVVVDGKLLSISSGNVIKELRAGGNAKHYAVGKFLISKDFHYYLGASVDGHSGSGSSDLTLHDYATGKELQHFQSNSAASAK